MPLDPTLCARSNGSYETCQPLCMSRPDRTLMEVATGLGGRVDVVVTAMRSRVAVEAARVVGMMAKVAVTIGGNEYGLGRPNRCQRHSAPPEHHRYEVELK